MEWSPFIVPVSLFVSMAFAAVGISIAKAYTRGKELEARRHGGVTPELEAKLDRMEQAIDAIAVEVERITENQRFTTRLLSERTGVPADEGERRLPER